MIWCLAVSNASVDVRLATLLSMLLSVFSSVALWMLSTHGATFVMLSAGECTREGRRIGGCVTSCETTEDAEDAVDAMDVAEHADNVLTKISEDETILVRFLICLRDGGGLLGLVVIGCVYGLSRCFFTGYTYQ